MENSPRNRATIPIAVYEAAQRIADDESRLRFYTAVMRYSFWEETPDFSENAMLEMAWMLIKKEIDKFLNMRRVGNTNALRAKTQINANKRKQTQINADKRKKTQINANFEETERIEDRERNEEERTKEEDNKEREERIEKEGELENKKESTKEKTKDCDLFFLTPDEPSKSCYTFDEFWRDYEKKVGRTRAERLYSRIGEKDREEIKNAVGKYIAATPDKQYRKDPATWLYNRCWEDEVIQPRKPGDIGEMTSPMETKDINGEGFF